MTQVQYEMIVKCINTGCSAFANELISALNGVIQTANEYNILQAKAREDAEKNKKSKKEEN